MRARRRSRLAFALGLLLAAQSGCGRSPVGPDDMSVAPGRWGGDHVELTVTKAGAHVEFNCASGDIVQRLRLDAEGRLAVDEVFVVERGPVRFPPQPARYSGRVDGPTMTLVVTLTTSNETVGTFSLVLGQAPRITKCV